MVRESGITFNLNPDLKQCLNFLLVPTSNFVIPVGHPEDIFEMHTSQRGRFDITFTFQNRYVVVGTSVSPKLYMRYTWYTVISSL